MQNYSVLRQALKKYLFKSLIKTYLDYRLKKIMTY